jgi:hypothetical protein
MHNELREAVLGSKATAVTAHACALTMSVWEHEGIVVVVVVVAAVVGDDGSRA